MKNLENHEADAATKVSGPRTALAAHTPGPWVQFADSGVAVAVMPAGRPGEICSFDDQLGVDQTNANARLIAAAPDLLSIAKRWGALDGGLWHVERHANDKKELLADTNAAIAKAVGDREGDAAGSE